MSSGLFLALAALAAPGPFDAFTLPEEWVERFWSTPSARTLLDQDITKLADLVPRQAGLRHCRCPACGADEREAPLGWSLEQPDALTCRLCDKVFADLSKPPPPPMPPNPNAPPLVESIEVLPGVVHKYPFVMLDPTRQSYPDERAYLAARRDYETRAYLAKAALYAAARARRDDDPPYARIACALLLRFAQVYPTYAAHYDQPGRPKFFQPARLAPPYRRGYATARWDWSGALEVSLPLALAYAWVRDSRAWDEVAKALDDPDPHATIEHDLFRAAATWTRQQPDEVSEPAVWAARGLLIAGRLLDDPDLVQEASKRVARLTRAGFHYDGTWKDGDAEAQARVVAVLRDWVAPLLHGVAAVPVIARARAAENVLVRPHHADEVRRASWPATPAPSRARGPALLGSAGIARLAVGEGNNALDLDLLGLGQVGSPRSARLALRLAVAGRPLLGDLDDQPPRRDGLELATASHNAVLIDGLNQRESLAEAHRPAPASDLLFFAAEPDFQVAAMSDRHAYPTVSTRYRHIVAAFARGGVRYAVSVFQVEGGLQHDQLWQAAPEIEARWRLALPTQPGPESLLDTLAANRGSGAGGRWFTHALGTMTDLETAAINGPTVVELTKRSPLLRLHVLGDVPTQAFVGASEDRAALALRRRATEAQAEADADADAETAADAPGSLFVTLLEPRGGGFVPPRRVGRVASPAGTVVLFIQSGDQTADHLVLNLQPGTVRAVTLADGRVLETDGLLARVDEQELTLAGGSFARVGAVSVAPPRAAGAIVATTGPGTFETDSALGPKDIAVGRALIVRHGDGTSRAWIVRDVERLASGGSRVLTVEGAGFRIDPQSGEAHYEQLPGTSHPGPHTFVLARIARAPIPRPFPANR